ncbi:MAG: Crp/Fnr family transcriptional regulator [Arcobacteraceae bacterium]
MKTKLKEIFLFSQLNDETLNIIAGFTYEVKLNKDNIVFYEGDEPKYLHILTKGIIKLYKTATNSKELVLKYFQSNELIAEAAIFQQIPYPATAQAYTNIEILKIDFLKLKTIMLQNPELCFNMQISLIYKIKNLENIISMQLVLDTKEKVAKYICENEKDFFNTKKIIVAQLLNITPETLSRTLKVFKDENLLDTKNKKIDKEKLSEYFI